MDNKEQVIEDIMSSLSYKTFDNWDIVKKLMLQSLKRKELKTLINLRLKIEA